MGFDLESRDEANRTGRDQISFFFADPGNDYLLGRRSYTMGDPNSEAYDLWLNGEAPLGVEETNTIETAAPRWKTIVTFDSSGEKLSALARVSAFASAERVFNLGGGFEPRQRYGAEGQLDLEASHQVQQAVATKFGAVNLLDDYPDPSIADLSYFGNLPYDILSPVGVNGRFLYSRLAVSL